VLVASIVLLVGCGGASHVETAGPGAQSTVSGVLAFQAPLLAGGAINGPSLAGKPVAFWFWAPT
jgi:hypothetical protein